MKIKTDGLKRDVSGIAFGRRSGTPGSAKARKYLVSRMEESGFATYAGNKEYALPYRTNSMEMFHNIVGVVKGKNPQLPPLLIGAHYDSPIDAPCADDNAAAVAIALAAGKALKEMSLERDVLLAIFDAEEPPHFLGPDMGSIRFYEDQMDDRGVHAAIIMDLVGHDVPVPDKLSAELEFISTKDFNPSDALKGLLFITGAESCPVLTGILESSGIPDGLNVINGLNRYVGDMSDHYIFRENGVPYLFLSCGQWRHYHRPSDTPDKLNYGKMTRITEMVVALTAGMADADMVKSKADSDTLELEKSSIRRALGPCHGTVLQAMGLQELETRKDVDAFVDILRSKFSL